MMATLFEEMKEAAETYKARLIRRNDSAKGYIQKFLNKFSEYTEIPEDKVKPMLWNEAQQIFTTRGTEQFMFAFQAVNFDEANDQWRVGVKIMITPEVFVAFGLLVTEKGSKYLVRAGGPSERPRIVDLENQTQREEYFASVATMIRESFVKPKQHDTFKYG